MYANNTSKYGHDFNNLWIKRIYLCVCNEFLKNGGGMNVLKSDTNPVLPLVIYNDAALSWPSMWHPVHINLW